MPTNNPTKARHREIQWPKSDRYRYQGKQHHSGYSGKAPSGRSGGSKYGANDDDFDDGYDEGYGSRREYSYYENCEADEIGHFTADGDDDYDDEAEVANDDEWLDCSSSDGEDHDGQPRYHTGHVPAMSLSLATLIASSEDRRQREAAAERARLERHHAANPEAAAARAELVAELEQLGISGFEATDAMLADPMVAERLRQFAIAARDSQPVDGADDDEDGMEVELTSADYVLYDASHETLAYRIPVELWDIVTLYAPPRSTIALACTSHWMRLAVEETGFWPRLRYSCRVEVEGAWKGKVSQERLLPRVSLNLAERRSDGRGTNRWERSTSASSLYSGSPMPTPKFPWSEFWSFFHFVQQSCSKSTDTSPPPYPFRYNWSNTKHYLSMRRAQYQHDERCVAHRKAALLAYASSLTMVSIIAWIELYRTANLEAVRDFARMQANRHAGMPNLALELLEAAEPLPPRVAARLSAPKTDEERRAFVSELTVSSLSSDREAEWDVTERGAAWQVKAPDCNEDNKPVVVENRRPYPGYARTRAGGRKTYHAHSPVTSYYNKELSLAERRLAMQVGFAKIGTTTISRKSRTKNTWYTNYGQRYHARELLRQAPFTSAQWWGNEQQKLLRDGLSAEERSRGTMPYNVQVERIQRPVADA